MLKSYLRNLHKKNVKSYDRSEYKKWLKEQKIKKSCSTSPMIWLEENNEINFIGGSDDFNKWVYLKCEYILVLKENTPLPKNLNIRDMNSEKIHIARWRKSVKTPLLIYRLLHENCPSVDKFNKIKGIPQFS